MPPPRQRLLFEEIVALLGMGEIEGGENVEVTEIAAAQRRFGSTSPNGSERDVGVRASIMGSLEYLKPLIKQ